MTKTIWMANEKGDLEQADISDDAYAYIRSRIPAKSVKDHLDIQTQHPSASELYKEYLAANG